ncbi:hypothetical protein D3C78_1303550 [compost metagenome]
MKANLLPANMRAAVLNIRLMEPSSTRELSLRVYTAAAGSCTAAPISCCMRGNSITAYTKALVSCSMAAAICSMKAAFSQASFPVLERNISPPASLSTTAHSCWAATTEKAAFLMRQGRWYTLADSRMDSRMAVDKPSMLPVESPTTASS